MAGFQVDVRVYPVYLHQAVLYREVALTVDAQACRVFRNLVAVFRADVSKVDDPVYPACLHQAVLYREVASTVGAQAYRVFQILVAVFRADVSKAGDPACPVFPHWVALCLAADLMADDWGACWDAYLDAYSDVDLQMVSKVWLTAGTMASKVWQRGAMMVVRRACSLLGSAWKRHGKGMPAIHADAHSGFL